ncbi:MAG: methylmalonyl Co-A mutase-associated GTPase MeaB [Candidatus Competibacteraceae bacterium]|nr:methylmalonyl Co-A mutase-associated GTPase MeaB [Candidatus Competibacteraceae bacterium]
MSGEKSLNPDFRPKFRTELSVETLVEQIVAGNRTSLAQAITLIESTLPADQPKQEALIAQILPYTGNSFRVGITGIPGAGKSTLIESLGMKAVNLGQRVAVLAVDPSSQLSGGSILGDKTRMENLSRHPLAFIRPSPSSGNMGGVARTTRESMLLCEAAGFNTLFIETVGVGQSETAVHAMVDMFVLITVPGTGDELQGIKRGIMEMADLILINKAAHQPERAQLAKVQMENILHLFPSHSSNQQVSVITCDALHDLHIDQVWQTIKDYQTNVLQSGYLSKRRIEQQVYWFRETLQHELMMRFFHQDPFATQIKQAENLIQAGKADPYRAALQLLHHLFPQS